MNRGVAILALLLLPLSLARAESSSIKPRVGEEHEITRSYETAEQGSDGSSSSSSGHDTILERVIGMRGNGLELQYDLPKTATKEDRARNWQFPAQVFKPSSGPMELLNRAELEARIDSWLKTAGWSRDVCGRWVFTWNAFRIECNPDSVLETLKAYDLGSTSIREGESYSENGARQPGTLARMTAGRSGAVYEVRMDVDAAAVRRARAESDVAVGEIMKKPVALEAALRKRDKEAIAGTISVAFDTDAAGKPWRRTKVTTTEISKPDGVVEESKVTEVLTRKLVD